MVLDFLLDDHAGSGSSRQAAAATPSAAGPASKSSAKSGLKKGASAGGNKRRKAERDDNDAAEQDDHSDQEDLDIASSLLPASAGKGKAKGKGRAVEGQEDEDDEAFIASAQHKHNVKAGSEVAIKAVKRKKAGSESLQTGGGNVIGGGSFQSMGLHPSLLRSLLIRGFTNPTPIQRQAIPAILAQPPRDLVGMARTGSGKTLAYLIPLIQRLQGRHSSTFGVKSLVLCPSRELALQILRVGKDIARGWKGDRGATKEVTDSAAGGEAAKEAIRWGLVVGGESLDEQFALIASNPDIIIATPGRLLHLIVEMNLDLSAVNYVVFDEADRLFEMGFAMQLEEMLLRLPSSRQTLLFSATLPKSLVEFAKAGLQSNPRLVRLDADSKISADLRMAFFSVKPNDKEAALLVLLRHVIGVPFGEQAAGIDESAFDDESEEDEAEQDGVDGKKGKGKAKGGWKSSKPLPPQKKRKRTAFNNGLSSGGATQLLPHQTVIFCATKHHVEYLLKLLTTCGYACSHIYSSLDQAARTIQMHRFRRGQTSLLIVTDVASRGIDLPVLEHVVNYDFAPQPRVFVHRVGRTARAGRQGWAWSFVTNTELPFLCDLQLFLARPLVGSNQTISVNAAAASASGSGSGSAETVPNLDVHNNMILGTFPRDLIDPENDYISHSLLETSSEVATALPALKQVVGRAQGMYERSRVKASQESHRRAKEMVKQAADAMKGKGSAGTNGTILLAGTVAEELGVHDVVRRPTAYGLKGDAAGGRKGKGKGKASAQDAAKAAATSSSDAAMEAARAEMLAKINGFAPTETIFEAGRQGANPLSQLMRARRDVMQRGKDRAAQNEAAAKDEEDDDAEEFTGIEDAAKDAGDVSEVDEEELKTIFDTGEVAEPRPKSRMPAPAVPKGSYRDNSVYLDYKQKGAEAEKGYSLNGGSFAEQAHSAVFDLNTDEASLGTQIQRPNAARWDTKKKKFIKGDGTGSDNKRLIKTESGLKLPASFRSGRFDEWRREQRMDLPKVGEQEMELPANVRNSMSHMRDGHRQYNHNKNEEARPVDRKSDKWAKNSKSLLAKEKQKREEAGQRAREAPRRGGPGAKRGGKKASSTSTRRVGTNAKSEVKSSRDIFKQRQVKQKRMEKNARPSKRGGKR